MKEISNMEDDIEDHKKDLEECREDIRIYTEEKENLSKQKHLYELRKSSQRYWYQNSYH